MAYDHDLALKVEQAAVQAKSSYPRWICTPEGEYVGYHGASDWCSDCGYFIVRHLRRKDRRHAERYFLDGGWRTESDSVKTCGHCGAYLRISLLDYGVAEELAYYDEYGIGKADENHAFVISLLLDATSHGGEYSEDVEALARRFVEMTAQPKDTP